MNPQPFVELLIPVWVNGRIDMKDILHVLGRERMAALVWVVEGLNWLGNPEYEQVFELAEAANAIPWQRILLPGTDLVAVVDHVYQTLEGFFSGYRSHSAAEHYVQTGEDGDGYETSAVIAIEAIDGDEFCVYAPARADLEPLVLHHSVELESIRQW